MEKNSISSQGIKTGVLAGVVSIVVVLLTYILNISMFKWPFMVLSYALLIGVMIYGLLQFRKANGGFMAFAQAILIVLVAGVICSIISYFFNLLYYNFINPNYLNEIIEYSRGIYEKAGIVMNEQMEEMIRTNAEKNMHFSVLNFVISIVVSLVAWSIFGSILGAIFSKKDPSAIA